MPQSIYNQKRDPSAKGINHCEMVCCVFCLPPTHDWELRKTSIKLKAHVLETIKVVEWKRPVKELTCPLFRVSWGLKGWITALIKTGKPSISMDWLFMCLFEMDKHKNKCVSFFSIVKVGKGKNHTETNLLYMFCSSPQRDLSWWGSLHGGALAVEGVIDALDGGGAWVELSSEVQTKAVSSSDIPL